MIRLNTYSIFRLIMVCGLFVFNLEAGTITSPKHGQIISYMPYKIMWSIQDTQRIEMQVIRISQDPFGDIIHFQRIIKPDRRDFTLRKGLADNQSYYLFLGMSTSPADPILWSEPVYFILDHLNNPPGDFTIYPIPDTLRPGHQIHWQASSDPDPLDSLLTYLIFAENLDDSSLHHEIPFIPENKKAAQYSIDITSLLRNHRRYRIKIFAEDMEGVIREGQPSQVTVFYNGTNNPPTSPLGLDPYNPVEKTPGDLLIWKESTDADKDPIHYTLHLDTTPMFANPVSITCEINRYLIRQSLQTYFEDDTKIYWRVRASDNWGGHSLWSTFGQFHLNFLNNPPYWTQDIHLTHEPFTVRSHDELIHWFSAVDDDFSDQGKLIYHIEIKSAVNPDKMFHYETRDTFYTIPAEDLQENERYTYTITVEDGAGNRSTQRIHGHITINCIEEEPERISEILHPSSGKILGPSGRLAWKKSYDPDPGDSIVYRLELSMDQTFNNIISETIRGSRLPVHAHLQAGINRWDQDNVQFYTDDPTIVTVQLNHLRIWPLLKDNQKYYFRITVIDKTKLTSPLSDSVFFILNKFNNPPEPVSTIYFPVNNTNIYTTSPEIHWKASNDPDPDADTSTTRYQLNILDADNQSSRYFLTQPGITRIVPDYPFSENGRYKLKIRSFDNKSAFSDWSESRYFWINEKMELPILNPDNFSVKADSILNTINTKFYWGPVHYPDPPEEQKDLLMDIQFTFPEAEDTIVYNNLPFKDVFSDSLMLLPENVWGNYSVRLKTADNHHGDWIEPIRIGVDIYADIPLGFYLKLPKQGQDTLSINPKFVWTECVDPDLNDEIFYTLYVSSDSTFYTNTYIVRNIQTTSHTLTEYDLEDNTKYFWKVSAEDKDGHIMWGSDSNFHSRYFIAGRLEDAENRQNYIGSTEFYPIQPNPFNGMITLTFSLNTSEEITLSVYNLIGQRVATIHHGNYAAGIHSIRWDITQTGLPLPAGVYIFTLRIQNRVLQQKGLFIK